MTKGNIIKEWHGKGGSILARFYACQNTNGSWSYFVDMKMCTVTVDVTCALCQQESAFYTYCGVYEVPFRYARFIYKYLQELKAKQK